MKILVGVDLSDQAFSAVKQIGGPTGLTKS